VQSKTKLQEFRAQRKPKVTTRLLNQLCPLKAPQILKVLTSLLSLSKERLYLLRRKRRTRKKNRYLLKNMTQTCSTQTIPRMRKFYLELEMCL